MREPLYGLSAILRSLRPELSPGVYAFCLLPKNTTIPESAIGWFRETEGVTVILPEADARIASLEIGFVAARITLTVHSALDSVGLTAAVSSALADAGISCNVVAAFFHDHLFVPVDRADEAMQVLHRLQEAALAG